MADYSSLNLPPLTLEQHAQAISALEAAGLSPSDLLARDARSLAARAQLTLPEVVRLQRETTHALRAELLGRNGGPNSPEGAGRPADAQLQWNEAPVRREVDTASLCSPGPVSMVSTLDARLDAMLGGGLPAGYVTEVVGESGAGKTQFLLSLLLAAQLDPPHGLGRPTIYISTEHALPTQRLQQMLTTHPVLTATMDAGAASDDSAASARSTLSLARVLTLHTPDLETQEHILAYQLPVACAAYNPGLIVLDSIAANLRDAPNGPSDLAARAATLHRTGALLRQLARDYKCAVVVSNHVADRFLPSPSDGKLVRSHVATNLAASLSSPPSSSGPDSNEARAPPDASPSHLSQRSSLEGAPAITLDHQQRFFTGWGADEVALEGQAAKTPALGLVWATQIAARIAITKEATWGAPDKVEGAEQLNEQAAFPAALNPRSDRTNVHPQHELSAEWSPRHWRRWMRLVFAAWAASTPGHDRGVEVEIWAGGIRAVGSGGHGPPEYIGQAE